MIEATLLKNLGFILIAATVFAFAGRSLRVPAIITYILAGLALDLSEDGWKSITYWN